MKSIDRLGAKQHPIAEKARNPSPYSRSDLCWIRTLNAPIIIATIAPIVVEKDLICAHTPICVLNV